MLNEWEKLFCIIVICVIYFVILELVYLPWKHNKDTLKKYKSSEALNDSILLSQVEFLKQKLRIKDKVYLCLNHKSDETNIYVVQVKSGIYIFFDKSINLETSLPAIAHELAHISLGHINIQETTRRQLVGLIIPIISLVYIYQLSYYLVSFSITLFLIIFFPRLRRNEIMADIYASNIVGKQEYLKFLEYINHIEGATNRLLSKYLSFLSTHPSTLNRIKVIKNLKELTN